MKIKVYDENGLEVGTASAGGGAGGTSEATYIVQTPDAALPNAQDLLALVNEFGSTLLRVTDGGVIANAIPGEHYIVPQPNYPLVKTIAVVEVGSGGVADIVFDMTGVWYEELELSIAARTNRAAVGDSLLIQFNDDAVATEYVGAKTNISDGTNTGYQMFVPGDNAGVLVADGATAADADGSIFGSVNIKIQNPVNALVYRVLTYSGIWIGNADGLSDPFEILSGGGVWLNSQGIIKIKLLPAIGTLFVEGSTIILKGIVSPFPIV